MGKSPVGAKERCVNIAPGAMLIPKGEHVSARARFLSCEISA